MKDYELSNHESSHDPTAKTFPQQQYFFQYYHFLWKNLIFAEYCTQYLWMEFCNLIHSRDFRLRRYNNNNYNNNNYNNNNYNNNNNNTSNIQQYQQQHFLLTCNIFANVHDFLPDNLSMI